MRVEFTINGKERDCLLAHVKANSMVWQALMGPAPDFEPVGGLVVRAKKIYVECEDDVAAELFSIAVNHCATAANKIAQALEQASG